MLRQLIKWILFTVISYNCLFSAASASLNGVWQDSLENFWLYLDEQGTVVAVEIKGNLTAPEIYLGSLAGSDLQVNALLSTAELIATVSETEDSLVGTLTKETEPSDYEASKIFSYEGSSHDGLWVSDLGNYLLYMSVNSQGIPLIVVLDITINEDQTVTHDVFVGSLIRGGFVGTSLLNSDLSMSLDFSEEEETVLEGKYIVAGIPREITEFVATRIFLIDPANLELETLKSEFDKDKVLEFIKAALSDSPFNIMQSKEAKLAYSMVESLTESQKKEIAEDPVLTSLRKANCSDLNYPDFWEWAGLCQ